MLSDLTHFTYTNGTKTLNAVCSKPFALLKLDASLWYSHVLANSLWEAIRTRGQIAFRLFARAGKQPPINYSPALSANFYKANAIDQTTFNVLLPFV